MKAVQFDHYGDLDVLYVGDIPAPTAEPGQVVVDVRTADTNPDEATIRKGDLASMYPGTFRRRYGLRGCCLRNWRRRKLRLGR